MTDADTRLVTDRALIQTMLRAIWCDEARKAARQAGVQECDVPRTLFTFWRITRERDRAAAEGDATRPTTK